MAADEGTARVPPRWFVRLAWRVHRGLYRVTGGRLGLWAPKPDKWGTLRLTTTGRRSGQQRSVLLGYVAFAALRPRETAVVVLRPNVRPVGGLA